MNILLTGASGFAGAHMLKFLLENTKAHIICPITYCHGGLVERIPSVVGKSYANRFSLIEVDLADPHAVSALNFSEYNLVVNYASESHVDRSISNPKEFTSNNTSLMINLLEQTRLQKNLPFVHLSTDEVYGPIPKGETNFEWQRIHLPSNPYSASKSAQESLAVAYFKTYKVPICIINATNMLGEAQNQEKFIPKVIRKILQNELINIDTNLVGEIGTRKYLDVKDVARAVWGASLLLLDRRKSAKTVVIELPYKFHISGTEEISNLEVVNIISSEMKKVANVQISPSPRMGYDLRYDLTSHNLDQINWAPAANARHRIAEVCKWTLANPEWLYHDHATSN